MHRLRIIHEDAFIRQSVRIGVKPGGNAVAGHAPGQVRVDPEGLLIDKVAPAADALTDEKA